MAYFEVIKRTPSEWTALNPTLLDNEIGVEEDVRNNVNTVPSKAKLGDGVTAWADLDYWSPTDGAAVWGEITGDITDQTDLVDTFAPLSTTVEIEDGAAYTLVPADNGKIKIFTHDDASAITVTYVAGTPGAELDVGFNCVLVAGDAGVVTVAADGTTINSAGGLLSLSAEFAGATFVVTATNTGLLLGSLA